MSNIELLKAELKVAELAEALVAAKEDGSVTRDQKLALREARQAFRELRSSHAQPVADGDAVANPDAIKAVAAVKEF